MCFSKLWLSRFHFVRLGTFVFLGIFFILFTAIHKEYDETASITQGKVLSARTLHQDSLKRYPREASEGCITNETVTPKGGTLTSPGYPNPYPSNIDCRWLLIAPDDSEIILRIESLDLEKTKGCQLDYLQIHFGPSTLSPSHERLCGSFRDKVVASNSSTVLLTFHSDPSYEGKGFSVDYYSQSLAGCPLTMREPSGVITSPNFPSNYPDNMDCWTLISVSEGSQISLEFDSIDLEPDVNCTFDYVQVYDGPTKDSPSFPKLCSNNQRNTIQSSSNHLLVNFHSDHLVNRKGYLASYSTSDNSVNDLGGCLWESGENNGTVASPNYPQMYPSNADCKVLLKASSNNVITIAFDALLLEVEANCSADFLEIRDGTDSESVTKLCGKETEPRQWTSTQSSVLLTFHSDDFAEFSGFKARYWFHRPLNDSKETHEEATDESVSTVTTAVDSSFDDIFIEKPQNATLTFGSPYMLQCAVKDPVAKIRWLKDDQFLGGNTPMLGVKLVANNTLWIQSINKQLTGVYTCAAVTPEKTYYEKAWVMLVGDSANDTSCTIVFLRKPRESSFTEGEFAYLDCLATGTDVRVYWEKDGLPLSSESNITVLKTGFLFKDKVTLQDAGSYTCVATDLNNRCQKRASVSLMVHKVTRLNEICGVPKIGQPSNDKPHLDHGKIVGGHNTKKGAYPWQVMLWEPHLKSFCGGSLINERWIITAAHCLSNYDLRWSDIIIKLGKHNREVKEPEEMQTVIAEQSSIVIHPAYDKNSFDNDIALIRLRDHVKFTDYILPICIGTQEMFEDSRPSDIKMGTVTGWGKLKENGASPKFLQEIQLPVVRQKTCVKSTSYMVSRNMFCAGYAQEILGDACSGDSGGPFVMKHENKWYLTGIVSWGEGCGEANKYGFYTKVTNYLPWIRGIMKS